MKENFDGESTNASDVMEKVKKYVDNSREQLAVVVHSDILSIYPESNVSFTEILKRMNQNLGQELPMISPIGPIDEDSITTASATASAPDDRNRIEVAIGNYLNNQSNKPDDEKADEPEFWKGKPEGF